MWLFTAIGFFSVVQKKPSDTFLTVRARVASDLDNLRQDYMPSLSLTSKKGGTDYPYRATISHADFGVGLARIGEGIKYSNFKSEVARGMGRRRSDVYHKVWDVMSRLESEG
jgi:hypothetical protein